MCYKGTNIWKNDENKRQLISDDKFVQLRYICRRKRMMKHKAGFVSIIGNPNVGKSTLMNAMLGERLSVITPKSQTTRHRIRGILNEEDFQIVFSDTPGVLKPNYALQKIMLDVAVSALRDADVIVYVTDVVEKEKKNKFFIEKVKSQKIPLMLAINKIDLLKDNTELEKIIDKWKKLLPQAEFFPISAKENFNIDNLYKRIIALLPENPPFFPKDELSDLPERFFVAEIIREKIFLNYQQEIPYAVDVKVIDFKNEEKLTRISAQIFVEKDSQKGILIGKQGKALKKVGTESRKDIEKFIGKKVFLELRVKVKKNWRNEKNALKELGYRG